jgi:hypothetical protein
MATFRSKMKAKFGKEEETEQDAAAGVGEEEELNEDTRKRERHVVNVLRKVRNKMIGRQLQGEVCLSVTAGLKTSSYSCEIDAESIASAIEEDPDSAEKSRSGMVSVEHMLNNLGG